MNVSKSRSTVLKFWPISRKDISVLSQSMSWSFIEGTEIIIVKAKSISRNTKVPT